MKALLIFCLLAVVGSPAFAQLKPSTNQQPSSMKTSDYQAGVHYDLINPVWPGTPEEPVIYEFFSYMCPGCNAFEPTMEQLASQLDEPQKIIRVPMALYAQWEPHAKAYHALQMMGEVERVHKGLFAAIHQYKKPLRSLEDIATWLSASYEIDAQKFLSTAQSFAVDTQLRKDKQMAKAMGVSRVPTLVVNGRYKPNFDHLKSAENILKATVYLVNNK